VITAGPTREAMDPVRYISNHSSGKMGFALARAAAEAGAHTILISGPVNLTTPEGVKRIDVESAEMMLSAVNSELELGADVFIGAAAVADYRPAAASEQKIKKHADTLTLELVKNPDIISHVAQSSHRPKLVVGFAAETEQVLDYARGKLQRKNLDAIVANDVSQADIGFNSDINAVTVIDHQSENSLPAASKQEVARRLVEDFAQLLKQKQQPMTRTGTRHETTEGAKS